jgi:branched-subunit amino acid ABC-type transport system permease component
LYLFFDSPGAVIVYASTVALIGTAFTLIHLASDFPNLYTGSFMGFGLYSAYISTQLLGFTPYAAVPAGLLLGGAVAATFYWLVVRILQRKGVNDVRLALSTIGLMLLLGAVAGILVFWLITYMGLYASAFELRGYDFQLLNMQGVILVAPLIAVASTLLLRRAIDGTRLGAAVRGSSENRELAMICGVNPYRTQTQAWFIAGGLVGVAGAIYPLYFTGDSYIGCCTLFTVVMASSILGGLGSTTWAIIGAFLIAPLQAVVEYTLSTTYGEYTGDYQWIIPLIVLSLNLYIQPEGLKAVYDRARRG